MSGIYYRTFFFSMRAKVIKPAIQDQPATFSSIISKGSLTVDGTVTISGSLTLSGSEDLVVNDITASGNISGSGTGSFAHIQLPGEGTIQFDNTPGSNDQYIEGYDNNINIYADGQLFLSANRHTFVGGGITASSDISASGEIIGNTLTISSNEINFANLPTSDPGVVGRLYRDGATVKISI